MKGFIIALVCLALIVLATSQPVANDVPQPDRFRDGYPVYLNFNSKDKCPAEHFFADCNFCNCPAGSSRAGCTKQLCEKDAKN